jgi:hypothetical protein
MQNTGRIIRLAASGEAEERATFPATEWLMLVAPTGVQIQRPWFLPSLLSAAAPDGVWITNGTSWELARHDLEGELDRIVRIATPLEPFSLDRIRALQERELAADLTDQARQSLTRTQEGRQYPETIRPIGALLADAAGRIWVGHQEVPPVRLPSGMGSTAREWTILADAGERLLGTVTLPEGRRPIHADRDGVLLLGVDEVDVPLLEWWRFVP